MVLTGMKDFGSSERSVREEELKISVWSKRLKETMERTKRTDVACNLNKWLCWTMFASSASWIVTLHLLVFLGNYNLLKIRDCHLMLVDLSMT